MSTAHRRAGHRRRHGMLYTRRELAALALAAFPASHLLGTSPAAAFQARPSSKVRGVMIGMNVPYNFGGRNVPVDDIIRNCVELGISGVELRTQPVETFLGAPAGPATGGARDRRTGRRPEGQCRGTAQMADLASRWTKSRPLRKKFEDAGHPRRDRQSRRHPHHARRGGRLRVPAGEGARGQGDLDRDQRRRDPSGSAGSPTSTR